MHDLTARGRVLFPRLSGVHRLFRLTTLDGLMLGEDLPGWVRGLTGLQEVALTSQPDAGRYRLVQWTGETVLEAEFEVAPDRPVDVSVELVAPFGEWLGSSRVIEGHAVPLRYPSDYDEDHIVLGERKLPTYRIGPTVTQRQFRTFCAREGIPVPPNFVRRGDSTPAIVSRGLAEAYARWCGARLPSARELAELLRVEEAEGRSGVLAANYRAQADGEWVGDVIHGSRSVPGYERIHRDTGHIPAFLRYEQLEQKSWGTPLQWLVEAPSGAVTWRSTDNNTLVGQSFRLARTEATLDEILQAQTITLYREEDTK